MLGGNIIIEPNEVWEYFCKHRDDFNRETHMIAERKDYGISIYLTESFGWPSFEVKSDDVTVYTENAISGADCTEIAKKIYERFLSDAVISAISEIEQDDSKIEQDARISREIKDREQELSVATGTLLDVILDENIDYWDFQDEIIEDVKDHICEYLYSRWGLEIYRPMIVEYEDKTEKFLKYPYSQLDLEED